VRRPDPSTSGHHDLSAAKGWLRSDLRAAPAAVWCLVVLHLLLLGVWTTLQPPFRGLDETAHISMVVDPPSPLDWPAPGEQLVDDTVISTLPDARYTEVPFRRLTAQEAQPRDERPSFAEAGPSGGGPSVNQMIQHPPLYYLYVERLLRLWPGSEGWSFDLQIAAMRGLSLLLVAPLPLLCWLAARRTGLSRAAGVAAAAFPLAVPGLTRVSSSVSNDALLVLAIGVASVLTLAVAGGDVRRRTAVALGATAVVGMYAKGLGLVLPVLVATAYVVAALRGTRVRALVPPAALGLGIPVLLGAPWYVRNALEFGAVQPNGYPGGGLPYERRQGGGFGDWAPGYVEYMAFRFWSALGNPEPPELPFLLCLVLSGVVVALAVLALAVARGRRLLVVLALLPLAGLLMLVAYGSYSNYQTYDRMIAVQGRYLYPAVVGLAVVLALALERVTGPLRRALPLLLLAAAGAMQVLAVRIVLTTYWTPAGDPAALTNGFDVLETWSPLGEAPVRALWVAAAAAAVVTGLAALRASGRERPAQA
jgi:4-amino-4-deoxy-L-arabinose transferase-like glycosyltransferase